MKRIFSLALAAAIAAGSMAVTTAGADARTVFMFGFGTGQYWGNPYLGNPYWGNPYRGDRDWDDRGSAYPHRFMVQPRAHRSDAHEDWCLAHHPSYNPATGFYMTYRGVWRAC